MMNTNTKTPLRTAAAAAIPINGSWVCTKCNKPVTSDAVTVDGEVMDRSCAEERLLLEAFSQCRSDPALPSFSVDGVISVLEKMRLSGSGSEPVPDPRAVSVGQCYRSTDRRKGERIVKVLEIKDVSGVGRRAVVQRCTSDGPGTYGIKTSLAIRDGRLDRSHWILLPSSGA